MAKKTKDSSLEELKNAIVVVTPSAQKEGIELLLKYIDAKIEKELFEFIKGSE